MQPVIYLPVLSTLFSAWFARELARRWRQRPEHLHLLWWTAGVVLYGAGTFVESYVAILGWTEPAFRAWYIAGALLGGAPLAQGTVYLLMKRRTAHRLSWVLVSVVTVAAACVLMAPVNAPVADTRVLSGSVLGWQWVRMFSPVINSYAFVFLVGGAAWSAWRYFRLQRTRPRAIGNIFIAIGALLPGIGGVYTRLGHTEVLYITELIGILLIYWGYRKIVSFKDEREKPVADDRRPQASQLASLSNVSASSS